MIEIFVCDDEKNITDFLRSFIVKNFGEEYKVVALNNCQDLIEAIEVNERTPEILIMDINLKDGNGIETVKRLQNRYPRLKVIYLTGVIDYATDIFETRPAYFLVKPVNENSLCAAINKVTREIELDRADSIVVTSNGVEFVLYCREIMYIESHGRKITLYMCDGTINEVYGKIGDIKKQLSKSFVRSHQSFLVNMKYVAERVKNKLYLLNGKVLPISRRYLNDFKMKFIEYLGESNEYNLV